MVKSSLKPIIKNGLLFILAMIFTSTINFAQIYSTGGSGNWNDEETWVGGQIPGAGDDVVIVGAVIVNVTAYCNNLTVEGTLQSGPNGQTHAINVYGNCVNNGTIIDHPDDMWYNLHVYLHGNLTNNGTFRIDMLDFEGATDQTVTTTSEFPLEANYIYDQDPGSDIIAGSDLFLEYYILDLDHGNLIANNSDIHFDYWRSNVNSNMSDINILANGNSLFFAPAAYPFDSVYIKDAVIRGQLSVWGGPVKLENITVEDTLQAGGNGNDHAVSIYGECVNNGMIIDNSSDMWYNLQVYLYGNLTNNGVFRVDQLNLMSDEQQTFSSTSEFPIEAYYLTEHNPSSPLVAGNELHLEFYILDLNHGDLILNSGSNLSIYSYDDHWGSYIDDASILANNNEIYFSPRVYARDSVYVKDAVIKGKCTIQGAPVTFENITVEDTLQGAVSSFPNNLIITGTLVNNGVIRDNDDDWKRLHLYIQGDVINNGEWINEHVHIVPGDERHFSQAAGTYFASEYFSFDDSTSVLTMDTDLSFRNTRFEMNYGQFNTLASGTILFDNVDLFYADLTLEENTSIILENSSKITQSNIFGTESLNDISFNGGSFIEYTTAGNIKFHGVVNSGYGLKLVNQVTIEDTLQGGLSNTVTIDCDADIVNNGSILKGGWEVNFYASGDVQNNGVWQHGYFYFNGTEPQNVGCSENAFFDIDYFMGTDTNTILNAGQFLNVYGANQFKLFDGTLNLAPNTIFKCDGGTGFYNADVYGNGAEVHFLNGAVTGSVRFNDVNLYGTTIVRDGTTFKGEVTNHDVLQSNYYNSTIYMYDEFINLGTIEKISSGLTIHCRGNITNEGSWHSSYIYFNGEDDQYFKILGDYPLEYTSLVAMTPGGPYQWYKNDEILPGATGEIMYINNLSSDHLGKYFCVGGSDTSRSITIMDSNFVQTITSNFMVQADWNLVSVPVLAADMTTATLFPTATSNAFAFDNGYIVAEMLQNGSGYWLKFASEENIEISGEKVNMPVSVYEGWNIIGPFEEPVPASQIITIPDNIIASSIYGYGNGYTTADELYPGKGYWVKVSQDGEMIFGAAGKRGKKEVVSIQSSQSISISDAGDNTATLRLAEKSENLSIFELPPAPPEGAFDVRFSSGRSVESAEKTSWTIDISSNNYPVTLTINGFTARITDPSGGNIINDIVEDGNSITITNDNIRSLRVEYNTIPDVYSLSQNYPNPFNPVTIIKFSLPVKSSVKLKVYNSLGEEVTTAINSVMEAGNHEIEFNAKSLSSGMYIYELQAGSFRSVKKMILMK